VRAKRRAKQGSTNRVGHALGELRGPPSQFACDVSPLVGARLAVFLSSGRPDLLFYQSCCNLSPCIPVSTPITCESLTPPGQNNLIRSHRELSSKLALEAPQRGGYMATHGQAAVPEDEHE
jgi:hypothetical protein